MALQYVGMNLVYVVDFDQMPQLPVTGNNVVERIYAEALTDAIEKQIVTEPGKYGIRILPREEGGVRYDIFAILE